MSKRLKRKAREQKKARKEWIETVNELRGRKR